MARKPRTKAGAPGTEDGEGDAGEQKHPSAGHNSEKAALTHDEMRALFTSHRSSWNEWKAKLAVVEKIERDVKAALKSDGFTVKQMQIADSLLTVKGEAKITGEVKERLQVALWVGHPMGAQLDLFEQPDRTPAVDRAFQDGKTAGLEGRSRKPPFSPELPQHEQWMNGWYEGQKIMMAKGGGFEAKPENEAAH